MKVWNEIGLGKTLPVEAVQVVLDKRRPVGTLVEVSEVGSNHGRPIPPFLLPIRLRDVKVHRYLDQSSRAHRHAFFPKADPGVLKGLVDPSDQWVGGDRPAESPVQIVGQCVNSTLERG